MDDPPTDEPIDDAIDVPVPARGHRPRSPRRRLILAVVAGAATALLLLGLDGLWAGRAMFRGVARARSTLGEGAVAVVSGDPAAARHPFEEAAGAARSAIRAGSHPSIVLAKWVPWLGDNVAAVEAVARASEQSARAGLAMVQAADTLGWHDVRVPATRSLGQVDLPALRAAAPQLHEVARTLGLAEAHLAAADTGRLVGPIATGFDDALETLRRRYRLAGHARDLARFLPPFLGAGGSRTYLVAVQTLGRPQGTGGQVDLVGTMLAERGRLSLSRPLAPAGDLYAGANVSLDGPTTAQELLRLADAGGLGALDGVILFDSVWLADALWVTGQVEVPGRARPLTMDDATDVLEREVFEVTSPAAAEQERARLANAILASYLERRPSAESFAIGSAGGAARRHLILYSVKPKEQTILERLGASGTFDPGTHPLSVTWRAEVDNHAVLFARRNVYQTVTLSSDGSARVRTRVELVNESPPGAPSVLLGLPLPATVPEPGGVDPVGGWAGEVTVTLPRDATRIAAETSVPSETRVVHDRGRPSVIGTLAADPGRQLTLLVSYRLDDIGGDGHGFEMLVTPQTSLGAGTFRVRIETPPGSTVREASEPMEAGGGSARFVGAPDTPLRLWVRW